jgi:hypothetical protein
MLLQIADNLEEMARNIRDSLACPSVEHLDVRGTFELLLPYCPNLNIAVELSVYRGDKPKLQFRIFDGQEHYYGPDLAALAGQVIAKKRPSNGDALRIAEQAVASLEAQEQF